MATSQEASGTSNLFQYPQETFHITDLDDEKIVITVQDSFSIGVGTRFGNDFSGPLQPKGISIYAEDILLSGEFKGNNMLCSANQISGISVADGNYAVLNSSGESHSDPPKGNNGPGSNGKQGEPAFQINVCRENIQDNATPIKFLAVGGNGQNGQSVETGTAGNGGNGGNVTMLFSQFYLKGIDLLRDAYNQNLIALKNYAIDTYINFAAQINNVNKIPVFGGMSLRGATDRLKSLLAKLQQNSSDQKLADQADTLIKNIADALQSEAVKYKDDKIIPFIETWGGNYGVYGSGSKNGTDGKAGVAGTQEVILLQSLAAVDQLEKPPDFLFVHPSQCAMPLQKAGLIYFMADPVISPQNVTTASILIKRLIDRTQFSVDLDDNSPIAENYSKNESSIGARKSVDELKNLVIHKAKVIYFFDPSVTVSVTDMRYNDLIINNRRSFMSNNFIIEDFPMSEIEFENRYHTEQACIDYLAKMKWPDGFCCRNCGHRAYWFSSKHLFICTRCESGHSLTAGTVMHGTKKPLTFWFKAMWWFTTRKSGVNAINLKDLLGLGSYQTAWTWLHKLRRCTIRQGREPLSGNVEVDEFVIGGQKPGKRGRGATGKTIVLAAVEKDGHKFGRIRLQVVPDCSGDVLEQFVSTNIIPGSTVATDGWKGYNFASKNYNHRKTIASKTDDKSSVLPGVHRIASLVKRLILGTFQGRFGPEHLQSYMDEYVFRFNRRTSRNIGKKFMRIVQQVTSSTKMSYNQIVGGASPFCFLAN